jgi:hypothetical protein
MNVTEFERLAGGYPPQSCQGCEERDTEINALKQERDLLRRLLREHQSVLAETDERQGS